MTLSARSKSSIQFWTAVLLPLILLMMLRIGYYCAGGESDVDNFYHAAMAQQGPPVFAAKIFPAASMSVWQKRSSMAQMCY